MFFGNLIFFSLDYLPPKKSVEKFFYILSTKQSMCFPKREI
jgi:hypothetical protein